MVIKHRNFVKGDFKIFWRISIIIIFILVFEINIHNFILVDFHFPELKIHSIQIDY